MTLNGHFTLNFHYCEQRFQKLPYILAVKSIYRVFLLYYVTSGDMRKRTVISRIFGICGLRMFRRRKVAGAIVGTLTNKANIIL